MTFQARIEENGNLALTGRFDASQTEEARKVFEKITGPATVDFRELEYISSAGLGVLLATQKRLGQAGGGLTLVNMNKHVRDVFMYAGFDRIFKIG
jgi:anti-sigma B factor antagonist